MPASFAGRSVSRGRAVGRALLVVGRKRQYFRAEIPEDRVKEEIVRFTTAVAYAAKQLEALIAKPPTQNAADIFDAHLPLLRYEHQSGIGLAIRKEVLARRGAIATAALRAPGPKLSPEARAEIDRLLARLQRRDPECGL